MKKRTAGAVAALTFALCLPAGFSLAPPDGSGAVIELFDGRDLSGWRGLQEPNEWGVFAQVALRPEDPSRFRKEPGTGVLVNGAEGRTANLLSEHHHGDAYLHVEFMVPHGSNSGVYFQGLYEIQILDSYGRTDLRFSDCGAIYARWRNGEHFEGHPPLVNASKPPGEWQSFDVVFRAPRFDRNGNKVENARFLLVVHNGRIVHQDVEVTGPTRAAMDRPESPAGPLMLQGDHGPVAFRNIKLVPLAFD